jgi:hypothetical protein
MDGLRMTRRWWALAGTAAAALTLLGCAAYGPGGLPAGASEAEVVARMGAPTARRAAPDGGWRLEYARGPMGLHTYLLDVDAAGRLQRWEQVLDAAHFAAVTPGLSREALLWQLGQPTETRRYARQNEDVWHYRHDSVLCWWFEVSLAIDGPVRTTGYTTDPRCERLDPE